MTVPVLLLAFDRPHLLRQQLELVSDSEDVSRVFVAIDGPQKDDQDNAARVSECIAVAMAFESKLSLKIRAASKNQGPIHGVKNAIDWFFEHEAEGIILEDDCRPDPSFFSFSREGLERYRNHSRVGLVAGSSFFGHLHRGDSVFFSRNISVWGWATWREAWAAFDYDLIFKPKKDLDEALSRHFDHSPHVLGFWYRKAKDIREGKVSSWAQIWALSCFSRGFLCVYPPENLIENVGFGSRSTHTKRLPISSAFRPSTRPLHSPLRMPERAEEDVLQTLLMDNLGIGTRGKLFRTVARLCWVALGPLVAKPPVTKLLQLMASAPWRQKRKARF